MGGKLCIVVIGAGLIGQRHIQHVINETRCELAGVVDTDPQKKTLADEAGVPYYPDVEHDMTVWSYGRKEQGWEHPIFAESIKVTNTVPLDEQLRHFCDVVQKQTAPRCSGEDALKTLEATLAIGESARSDLPVNLTSRSG